MKIEDISTCEDGAVELLVSGEITFSIGDEEVTVDHHGVLCFDAADTKMLLDVLSFEIAMDAD